MSAIPVMSVQGIHDIFLAEGNTNGQRFEFFIWHYLLPILMPFNGVNPPLVVIISMTSIQLIESVGTKVSFSYHSILLTLIL